MLREFKVPCGDSEKRFLLDDELLLYHFEPKLPSKVTLKDEETKVREALERPIGTDRLRDILEPGDRVVLLTDDWTRTTPVHKVIPLVLQEFFEAGVREKDVTIIVATGTHEPLTETQLRRKLGSKIVEKFKVENHDPDRNLVKVGTSSRGTPAFINRRVVEADKKVAIGGIVAHPLMGYGGGAKIIVPGVAGTRTVDVNHAMGDHQKAFVGIADGNPVREDAEEIARMVGLDFIVNVIMDPRSRIIGAVAGDMVKAHRAGVEEYNKIYGVKVGEEADIVVLGSSPRDATVFHGTFALPTATPFVKEGGTVVWVAACLAGAGDREERLAFRELMSMDPDEMIRSIKDSARRGEESLASIFDWHTCKVLHRNKVVLVSDKISRSEAEEFGFNYEESVQEALDEALRKEGGSARVTVLPVGGLTVPVYD